MAKVKDFNIGISPADVLYTSISTSKNGYNSANITIKKNDKEYMHVSYEWEGADVPSFALDLMEFMKSNNKETSGVWEGREDDYKEFSSRDKI